MGTPRDKRYTMTLCVNEESVVNLAKAWLLWAAIEHPAGCQCRPCATSRALLNAANRDFNTEPGPEPENPVTGAADVSGGSDQDHGGRWDLDELVRRLKLEFSKPPGSSSPDK